MNIHKAQSQELMGDVTILVRTDGPPKPFCDCFGSAALPPRDRLNLNNPCVHEEVTLASKLFDLRREFLLKLLSLPEVQELWIATLREALLSPGRISSALVSGGSASKALIGKVLGDIAPGVSEVARVQCPMVRQSLRDKLAIRIFEIPMATEAALALAERVVLSSESEVQRRAGEEASDIAKSDDCSKRVETVRESAREEAAIARERVAGVICARDEYLVLKNKLFERYSSWAACFTRASLPVGVEQSDVRQVAAIGLLAAMEKQSLNCEAPFETRARGLMAGLVKKFVQRQGWLIRVPDENVTVLRAMKEPCAAEQGDRFLRPDEVARQFGVNAEIGVALERLARRPVADVCDDIPAGGTTARRGGILVALEVEETRQQLYKALDCLSEDERRAISFRFGLEGSEDMSYPEIGRALGCSVGSAYGKVNAALGKLRRRLSE